MKKFFTFLTIALFSLFCAEQAKAEKIWLEAYELSIKFNGYGGSWTEWSPWEKTSVKIEIDIDNDLIIIYSASTQYYKIYDGPSIYEDSYGYQVKFWMIDQDDDRGTLRIRKQNNGVSQIYIDFKNVQWVYNVNYLEETY